MSVQLSHARTEAHAQMESMPTHVPVQPAMKEATVGSVSTTILIWPSKRQEGDREIMVPHFSIFIFYTIERNN